MGHAVQYIVRQYGPGHSVADAASKCSPGRVDAHGVARHPGGIKYTRLVRQVGRRLDRGQAFWERLEHRHPEVAPEIAIVSARHKQIPLPESGAGATVAAGPNTVCRCPQNGLNGCVAELDF